MYNLNPLMRNVLITQQEVIFHAPTKQTLDSRMIEQSIIVAEERWIREELGSEFYEDLISKKNLIITSGNLAAQQVLVGPKPTLKAGDIVNAFEYLNTDYQNLWKMYLWKIVAECVLVSAFPEGYVQMGSQGVFHTVPPAGLQVTSGEVTPLLSSVKWMMDKKIQDRVSPLLNSMHIYLCKNKTTFTLYKKDCADCIKDEENVKVKNAGLALGIYDDSDKSNGIYNFD